MHAIRGIRNICAHEMKPLDFTSNEIVAKMEPFAFIHTFSSRRPKVKETFIAGSEFCLGGIWAIRGDERRFRKPASGSPDRRDLLAEHAITAAFLATTHRSRARPHP